jgi:hypothetical protein
MIEQATVNAYGEAEQLMGFYTMIEDHLAVPFQTMVLGVSVTVKGIDMNDGDDIVAICIRGRHRQAVPIIELPLPSPLPACAEWIDAYRCWREP